MTANEAYKTLNKKYPELFIGKCYDYKTRFVFIIENENGKGNDMLLDNALCVMKDTGEVRDFKPFHISLEEYRTGKKVANFKD